MSVFVISLKYAIYFSVLNFCSKADY